MVFARRLPGSERLRSRNNCAKCCQLQQLCHLEILPWRQQDNPNIAWDLVKFDKTLIDMEPEQGVPRYVRDCRMVGLPHICYTCQSGCIPIIW